MNMDKKKEKKPTLSQKKINKYVKDGGGYCPFCGSADYGGHSLDFEGNAIYQRISCNDCGRDWVDCYTLTNVLE